MDFFPWFWRFFRDCASLNFRIDCSNPGKSRFPSCSVCRTGETGKNSCRERAAASWKKLGMLSNIPKEFQHSQGQHSRPLLPAGICGHRGFDPPHSRPFSLPVIPGKSCSFPRSQKCNPAAFPNSLTLHPFLDNTQLYSRHPNPEFPGFSSTRSSRRREQSREGMEWE